jgi:hypothetical protein
MWLDGSKEGRSQVDADDEIILLTVGLDSESPYKESESMLTTVNGLKVA